MNKRRNFLRLLSGLTLFSPFMGSSKSRALKDIRTISRKRSVSSLVQDEQFWHQIRQAFTVSSTLINLNNGGVAPQPKVVQEVVEHYNRYSNEAPSFYMWRYLDQGRESIRRKLADLGGCSPNEISICRNTTEALNIIILGLPLQKGDEVVMTKYDYPNMYNAWKQRALREGINLKFANIDPVKDSEESIINAFVNQLTDKTKVVHLTHVLNWNGRIMPVRAIADIAKSKGIEVLVDGAHSFAHLNFSITDLNCDYFGTSLHKWLSAPLGSGMLYIKKQKISKIYPLFASSNPQSDDVRKFENMGTRSFAIEQGIGRAIDFHLMIGTDLKQQRLQYLKQYWVDRLSDMDDFNLLVHSDLTSSCAIALFALEGKDSKQLARYLQKEYYIHVGTIQHDLIDGVRVTPNVFTLTNELDQFVSAVKAYKA